MNDRETRRCSKYARSPEKLRAWDSASHIMLNEEQANKMLVIGTIEKHIGAKLADCETRFIEKMFAGSAVELRANELFRLDVLKCLLLNPDFHEYLPMTGISITGGKLICAKPAATRPTPSPTSGCEDLLRQEVQVADIDGSNQGLGDVNGCETPYYMDLSCVQFNRQIKITKSTIYAGINLSYCTLKSLVLEDCNLPFIQLNGSTLKGNLYIRKCVFFDPSSSSMHAENLIVDGSISFTESVFISGVNLRGAQISANADFSDAVCISQEVAGRIWPISLYTSHLS